MLRNSGYPGEINLWRRFNSPGCPVFSSSEARPVYRLQDQRFHRGINPLRQVIRISRVQSQSLNQEFPSACGLISKVRQMWPGCFRVNKVWRYRRNTTPIINASINDLLKDARTKVRWCLDIHPCPKNDSCQRNSPEQLIHVWLWRIYHQCFGLGPKILNNDFLDMAMGLVRIT